MELYECSRNTFGTEMKIVDIVNSDNITIEFMDDYKFRKVTIYQNFKTGQIKNPYDKNICGVGYYGDGKYTAKDGLVHTKEYRNWICMIRRCYDVARKDRYSAYYGKCTVCEEWHNFQTFAKWYDENYYEVGTERTHIDKDILINGNTLYSPNTCLLVPQRINMLFLHKPNKQGLPLGVKEQPRGRYYTSYNGQYIGVFGTIEEAAMAHDKYKKMAIKNVAEEYKSLVPPIVYEALINWTSDYIKDAA